MNPFSISYDSIGNRIPDFLKEGFQLIGNWAGRVVKVIQHFVYTLRHDQRIALTVFATANLILLTSANLLANYLERRIANDPKKFDKNEYKFNTFIINGCVVGASIFICNVGLAKLLRHPVSNWALVAVSIAPFVTRFFFNPSLRKVDSSQAKPTSPTHYLQQKPLLREICSEVRSCLLTKFDAANFSKEQKHAREKFLADISRGLACIEGKPDLCRTVCVSVQAAFEKSLANKLRAGKIKALKAIFLTPLPCTPLRTSLNGQATERKHWTVEMRAQTVRELREAGADLFISYSADDARSFVSKNKHAFATYEQEILLPRTHDLPLQGSIPQEWTGAIYTFIDEKNQHYQLSTQGIQIQQHGKKPKECWKAWLSPLDTNSKESQRIQQIFNFLNSHQTGKHFKI